MITIEFEYLQNKIIIQGNLQEKFQEAINKFIGKTSLNPQNLTFLANGNICKSEMTLESQMSNQNKINNFMPVIVKALPEREKKKEPFLFHQRKLFVLNVLSLVAIKSKIIELNYMAVKITI